MKHYTYSKHVKRSMKGRPDRKRKYRSPYEKNLIGERIAYGIIFIGGILFFLIGFGFI